MGVYALGTLHGTLINNTPSPDHVTPRAHLLSSISALIMAQFSLLIESLRALPDHQSKDCCRGFGERAVDITDSDLNEWSDGAEWGLWLVSSKWGRSPGHFFWKMALIPSDCE